MHATQDQHDAHHAAYLAWREAEVAYWTIIDKMARQVPVDDAERDAVLERLDATHKAWMRAGQGICYGLTPGPAH